MFSDLKRVYLPILVFSFVLLSSQAWGQLELSSSDAKKEARSASREAGFETIYVTSDVIDKLLGSAAGMKFYTGLTDQDKRNAVLMLVPANADGSEIGDICRQNNEKAESIIIDIATKDKQVANIQNSNIRTPIESYFTATELRGFLGQGSVSGLHFMPSKITDANGNQFLTLIVAAASSPTNTLEMTALRSPCPPECPR